MRRKRRIRSLEVNYIANNKAVMIVDSSYIPKLSLKSVKLTALRYLN